MMIKANNATPVGMQFPGYGNNAAIPKVILTDANRRIISCDRTCNYRVRPEPETFLSILDVAATP